MADGRMADGGYPDGGWRMAGWRMADGGLGTPENLNGGWRMAAWAHPAGFYLANCEPRILIRSIPGSFVFGLISGGGTYDRF